MVQRGKPVREAPARSGAPVLGSQARQQQPTSTVSSGLMLAGQEDERHSDSGGRVTEERRRGNVSTQRSG